MAKGRGKPKLPGTPAAYQTRKPLSRTPKGNENKFGSRSPNQRSEGAGTGARTGGSRQPKIS